MNGRGSAGEFDKFMRRKMKQESTESYASGTEFCRSYVRDPGFKHVPIGVVGEGSRAFQINITKTAFPRERQGQRSAPQLSGGRLMMD